jgi:cytoskeletal protein CcmA (bactofilin family)
MKTFRRRIRDSSDGPRTYIAEGSKLRGNVTGRGAFVFCGEVEGDCDIEGLVTLTAGSRWIGTLKGTDVIVAGSVDGEIIAAQRVEVGGTARIRGSLSGHSIAVAEGAMIEGELRVTSGAEPVRFDEKRNDSD